MSKYVFHFCILYFATAVVVVVLVAAVVAVMAVVVVAAVLVSICIPTYSDVLHYVLCDGGGRGGGAGGDGGGCGGIGGGRVIS